MLIDDNCVVSMHYRLSNALGEVIDDSHGELPLVYMHNSGCILPSLERELTGKRKGDHLNVVIYPEDAYGYADEELIQELPHSALQGLNEVLVGARIKVIGKGGDAQLITVRELREDTVLVDGNHPLAGQVLIFDIAVIAVREPTVVELEQGFATNTNAE